MTIRTLDIRDRFERAIRAEVYDVPNVVDRHTGTEYVVTHVSVKWTWTARTNGYTNRDVGLSMRRVLKSGRISDNPQSRHMYEDQFPEWLAVFVATYTPEEYRAAIRENRRVDGARKI